MQITERKSGETSRDYAYRVLKENIISLDLKPGEYVSEKGLAEELGLSRTPVREAIIDLSRTGIINIVPQKGNYISKIDYDTVEESQFMRVTMEKAIVNLACDPDSNIDFSKLEENVELQRFYLNKGMIDKMLDLDNQFHELIFDATNKKKIYDMVRDLTIHFERLRSISIRTMDMEQIVEDHENIYKYIMNGEADKAVRAIDVHLGRYKVQEQEIRDSHPDYFIDSDKKD